jgi:hypothetical protein
MEKIEGIEKQLAQETDPEKLKTLGATLSTLLESLERIKQMKK